MNFDLSEEQILLRDSVSRFVQDNYDLDSRTKLSVSELGYSQQHWNSYAELGWLSLPFSEDDGGVGGSLINNMLVMEELGKGLVVEPFFATVIMGGAALDKGASTTLKDQLIPQVINGQCIISFAYAEEQSRHDLNDVLTTATAKGDSFIINGQKSVVLNGASSNYIMVSARTSGEQRDESGISLFLVATDSAGISTEHYPTVDGLRASEFSFENVEVKAEHLLGKLDQGHQLIQHIANTAILALSAEAVGCMEVLYKDTVEYTQQREQFGHPLSDFQVLQHRMVEMFVEYELCKSLLYRATMEAEKGADTANRTIHALKSLVGKAGTFIGENAVQLHGGMGVTEELRIGHYFKRLMVIDSQFGDGDFHLAQFIQ